MNKALMAVSMVVLLSVCGLVLLNDDNIVDESSAVNYTDGNWTFTVVYTESGDGTPTARLTKFNGTGVSNLIVPSTVSGGGTTYTVTSVSYSGNTATVIPAGSVSSNCTLTLPSTLVIIGSNAFANANFGGTLIIPDSVTTITNNAFYTAGFSTVVIPNSVTSIGSNGFGYCTKLKTVYNASSLNIQAGATTYGGVARYANAVYECHTVTVQSNNTSYGTVSDDSLIVVSGQSMTVSGNTLTSAVPGQPTITATPHANDTNWRYSFSSWSNATGAVSADRTVTANFTRVANTVTITVNVNNSGYGSVNHSTLTVAYGSTFSVNGNVVTIGGQTVTATPSTNTAQYTYSFSSWSNASGTVTANKTITANFTRTVNNYTVTIQSNNTDYGTVNISSVTVPYGTSISASGNVLTIGSNTITATAKTNTAQYTYTFSSWTNATGTVTGAKTITANFARSVNNYTVTFQSNDTSYGTVSTSSVTVPYGTSISISGNVYTVGTNAVTATSATSTAQYTYAFVSWSDSATSVTANKTVTATFSRTINQYTVTIQSNEPAYGTVSTSSVTVPYGTTITTSGNILSFGTSPVTTVTANETADTVQYRYDFVNWTNATGTVTGAKTITANFTRTLLEYTVSFQSNDYGTVSESSVTVPYGTAISIIGNVYTVGTTDVVATPLTNTAQYTYAFVSWSDSSASVTGNMIVSATFSRTLNQYTVTIQSNNVSYGDVNVHSLTVDWGTAITVSDNTLVIGTTQVIATPASATAQYTYAFANWTNATGDVVADRTVTANFTRTVNQYTITIVSNDANWGTVDTASITVDYGTAISSASNVLTIGSNTITATPASATVQYTYTFANWANVGVSVTGDKTITANFARAYTQYTVTIQSSDLNSGDVDVHSVTVDWNTPINVSNKVLTIGSTTVTATEYSNTAQYTYYFDGWTNTSGTVVADRTITANFHRSVNNYTITFQSNDITWGTVSESTVTAPYGTLISVSGPQYNVGSTAVVATQTPTSAQYTYAFVSWSDTSSPLVADRTVTATFSRTINQYTVTIVSNDLSLGDVDVHSVTVDWGTNITYSGDYLYIGSNTVEAIPTAPTSTTAYWLDSWTNANGAIIENRTVTAVFDSGVREYLVTFISTTGYGTTSKATLNVSYDSTVVINGNTIYIGAYTVIATPATSNAQYTYSFVDWSNASSPIQGDRTILANFTRTLNTYTVSIAYDYNAGTVTQPSVTVPYGSPISVSGNVLTVGTTNVTATKNMDSAQYTYTFDGWSNVPASGVIESNITVTAELTRTLNQYTVIISPNAPYGNLNVGSITVDYGTSMSVSGNVLTIGTTQVIATPNTDTVQYDYSFVNYTGTSATVTGAMNITANFSRTIITYTVTIQSSNVSYGTVNISSVTVPYGTSITESANIVSIGTNYVIATAEVNNPQYSYSFDGWYNLPASEIVESNFTVTALFSASLNQYTVSFAVNANYGIVTPSSMTVPYGTVVNLINNELYVGGTQVIATPFEDTAQYDYGFVNWTGVTPAVVGNTTITANFSRTVNEYVVTVISSNTEYGTVSPGSVVVPYGTMMTTHNNVLSVGTTDVYANKTADTAQYTYTFNGWGNISASEMVVGNITVVANFTHSTNQYTITIAQNAPYGNVNYESLTVDYGTSVSTSANILTVGGTQVIATPFEDTAQYDYGFVNWTGVTPSITADVTVTANFSRTVNQYTVTIVSNDTYYGTVNMASVTVEYGSPISTSDNALAIRDYIVIATPADATAQYSYAFVEWTDVPISNIVESNRTITAVFSRSINEYTVTIVSNNDEYGTVSVGQIVAQYGTQIIVSNNELHIGADNSVASINSPTAQYTFSFVNWTGVTPTVVRDVTITANFDATVNTYLVTFTVREGYGTWSLTEVEVAYGSPIVITDNTVRVGTYSATFTITPDTDSRVYYLNGFDITPNEEYVYGATTIDADVTAHNEVSAFSIVQPQYESVDVTKKDGPAWALVLVIPTMVIIGLIITAIGFARTRESYDDF